MSEQQQQQQQAVPAQPTQAQGGKTGFDALDVAVEFLDAVAPVIERIQSRDRSLADEARRASQSVVLNLAEGRRRCGKDRLHCFRIASGSGEEARAALRVARAWRYAPEASFERPFALLDRVLAMSFRLSRG